MRILLATFGWENLGVAYLASLARKMGHSVDLLFDPGLFEDHLAISSPKMRKLFDPWPEMEKKLLSTKPDIIGVNIFSSGYNWARKLTDNIRRIYPDIKIIAGGPHATVTPKTVLEKDGEFDGVMVGESEIAWQQLLERYSDGDDKLPDDIKGLWVRKNGAIIENGWGKLETDLDSLPFPAKDLFAPYFPIKHTYNIIATRGCPYSCSFCQNSAFKKQYGKDWSGLRARSPENLIDELKQAKSLYGIRFVHFIDDCFTTDKHWLAEFLPRYKKEVGLPFSCINHPATIDEERSILLKDSGCHSVVIGVQSWDAQTRKGLYGRGESNEQIRNALKIASSKGLRVIVNHINNHPGETLDDLETAASEYANHKLMRIATFHLTYFPGTDLTEHALNSGWINPERLDLLNEGRVDDYHDGGSQKDPHHTKLVQGFELLVHMYPLMPKSIKKILANKTGITALAHAPRSFKQIADLLTTFIYNDQEPLIYMRYYLHHLKRALGRKFP